MKVTLLLPGRPREGWIEEGYRDYSQRMGGTIDFVTKWVKNSGELMNGFSRGKGQVLALDPGGELLDSETFAKRLRGALEKGGSRLTIVMGAPDGLPREIRQAVPLISLSPLTFPHQLCRLVLAEQLYRATQLWRGSRYHR